MDGAGRGCFQAEKIFGSELLLELFTWSRSGVHRLIGTSEFVLTEGAQRLSVFGIDGTVPSADIVGFCHAHAQRSA